MVIPAGDCTSSGRSVVTGVYRESSMTKRALFLAAYGLTLSPTLAMGSMIYGLNKTGGIYSIDVGTGASSLYRATPAVASKTPNGLAYDVFNDAFYYNTQEDRKLYRVDSSGESLVATLPTGMYYDSAFWGGGYWSVREGSRVLMRVDVTGGVPVVSNYTLSGVPNLTFGDIAINADGELYGSAAQGMFKVNLLSLNPGLGTGSASLLSTSTPRLQLGFAGNVLYGVQTDTDRVFHVNTGTGGVTQTSTLMDRSLTVQDAAGVVPEPAGVLPLLALGAAVGLRRRRG